MCDIFVHYNRVFGTDIGYRKLKALKNAEVEYNSEQKKHWWNGINCEYWKSWFPNLKGKFENCLLLCFGSGHACHVI
jgi:hypothetical protein